MRLQRFLAQSGVASRRKSEDLIAAGVVAVNDRVVTTPGTTVDPVRDVVTVRGRPVVTRSAVGEHPIVVALHKPAGVVTARGGRGGERTVYDLVEEPPGSRLVYVGRLDRDTEGLLLLTTDGTLAHRLSHPRWGIERVYRAWVVGSLDESALRLGARRGLVLPDGERMAPFRVRFLARPGKGDGERRRLELVLGEGRKREVRRMVAACGGRVERLVRTRYGPVSLGDLAPGSWRRLGAREVERLVAAVGLAGGAASRLGVAR
jgi:23S rRNA pseudouridine2605 synthase